MVSRGHRVGESVSPRTPVKDPEFTAEMGGQPRA